MSDHHSYDPFLAPGPGAAKWQGTPIPSPPPMNAPSPSYIAPSPSYIPPPPGYIPPPPGYAYAANYPSVDTSNNWMGITSLVLSLSSFAFGITCIGGVIFGHMGLAAANEGKADNRGLALAGVIIGWVFLGLGLLYVGFMVFLVVLGSSASR